tara:strand:+ start:24 stop:710 length:687 start_codon:yes stop_codon:yes gene_type:complete
LSNNPIFCAIDTGEIRKAKDLIKGILPFIGGIKIGLEFFTALGTTGIEDIKKFNKPIFIDLKLYDIPNTCSKALRNILKLEPEYTTLHISGGRRMLENCVEEKIKSNSSTKLIGVTMLTSFDDKEINEIGIDRNVEENVNILSSLAESCELDGIVCSPHEISNIKNKYKLKIIVPGIRTNDSKNDNQKRTLNGKQAIEAGADILVIGRPITQAENPAEAARSIFDSIQ